MTLAPVATTPLFVEGGSRFVPHIVRLRDIVPALRAAMTEVWDALMALNRFNDTLLPDTLTDRFLAQYTGRSRRFIQKGLKGLQDAGIIFRRTQLGRRNIEITGRIAGRKEQPAAGDGPGPATRKARPGPAPGPPPRPTTPEQLAAAASAQAEATGPAEAGEPERLPGETARQFMRRVASLAAAAQPPEAPPEPRPRPTPRPRKDVNPLARQLDPRSMAEILAELEARKAHPALE